MYDLEVVIATNMDDKLTLWVDARGYNTKSQLLMNDVIIEVLN